MRKADNLPPYRAVVMKSGSLNFLEPSGPAQVCYGRTLRITLYSNYWSRNLLSLWNQKAYCVVRKTRILDPVGRQLIPGVHPLSSKLPLQVINLTKDNSVSVLFFCYVNMNTISITKREGLNSISDRICCYLML